jgi:hypothetical protein
MVLACLMFGYLAPVFWMFIEGVYLHSRLATSIFDATAPFKLYYCIGWGEWLPTVFPLLSLSLAYSSFPPSFILPLPPTSTIVMQFS